MESTIHYYENFFEKSVTVKDGIYSVFNTNGFQFGLFAYEKNEN